MNRRQALIGLASATAVAPVIAASAAKAATQSDRSAWNKAMADHLRAVAEADAFDAEYERVADARTAAVKAVPHVEMPNGYGGTLTTADQHQVAIARWSCKSLRYVETCAYEGARANQSFVDAADKRDAEIAQIDRRFRWDEVNEHYDALQSAMCDTETVLLNLPAPDGEALLWKIERLYRPGDGVWSEGVEDQTYADLHRFLSCGRA